jgi:hypothetical protein
VAARTSAPIWRVSSYKWPARTRSGVLLGSHRELLKLGFKVSERTVSRLMPRRRTPPSQTWRTFLENHLGSTVAVDFFTVPTLTCRILFVFVSSRRPAHIRHVNVTRHPTSAWIRQQIQWLSLGTNSRANGKRIAGNRDAEVGRMREIDRRLATTDGHLLEEHLGLDAMPRPPVAKAPLQRPRLPWVKLLRIDALRV